MNRFGALLLAVFILIGIGFALVVRRGDHAPDPAAGTGVPVAGGPLRIPVAGVRPDQLADSWGQERGGGTRAHHAIDIMAPRGTPVIAAAAGTVEKIFESVDGGHTVYVRSPDRARIYYYAHLDGYAPGLVEGARLAAGAPVGTVGSTGSAAEDAPHLHFEIKLMQAGESWSQGTEVDPYPLLRGA